MVSVIVSVIVIVIVSVIVSVIVAVLASACGSATGQPGARRRRRRRARVRDVVEPPGHLTSLIMAMPSKVGQVITDDYMLTLYRPDRAVSLAVSPPDKGFFGLVFEHLLGLDLAMQAP